MNKIKGSCYFVKLKGQSQQEIEYVIFWGNPTPGNHNPLNVPIRNLDSSPG